MLNKPGLLTALAQRMDWLGQRQGVVADNIANADTQDYRARDLDEASFHRALTRQVGTPLAARQTHVGHLVGSKNADTSGAKVVEAAGAYEISPTGNSVVLEEQLIMMNQVQADHNMMVRLYKKHAAMIRLALKGSR
ncbi:MAG: flagellar basal body rod protein FlgB [Pseudomonadota bacterium]